MEFIHHHLVNICFCSIAQRNIGHDFSSSSDNGRIPVDCGVTCHHANIFRPKNLAQREKFLTHEGLNWSSVERALPPRHSDKVRSIRDHRFTGAGRRCQDNVIAS